VSLDGTAARVDRSGTATVQPSDGAVQRGDAPSGILHLASALSAPSQSPLCDDRDLLAPWLADLLCPDVASSPGFGDLLDGVFPILGATITALVIAGLVMFAGGLILRRVGRTSTDEELPSPSDDRDAA
jgi:hypothetical protein